MSPKHYGKNHWQRKHAALFFIWLYFYQHIGTASMSSFLYIPAEQYQRCWPQTTKAIANSELMDAQSLRKYVYKMCKQSYILIHTKNASPEMDKITAGSDWLSDTLNQDTRQCSLLLRTVPFKSSNTVTRMWEQTKQSNYEQRVHTEVVRGSSTESATRKVRKVCFQH